MKTNVGGVRANSSGVSFLCQRQIDDRKNTTKLAHSVCGFTEIMTFKSVYLFDQHDKY